MKLKFISLFTLILLISNILIPPVTTMAVTEDAPQVISGTYQYTSNENGNKQLEDTFEYRDDCFMRSSFLGCEHLEILSSQVAIASGSRYGLEEDKYEIDYSNNAYNVENFLRKMDFKDVSTNKYYTLEKEENSGAVAVGHKEIIASGKTYTLLAVIPRSAGYKQEWAGNLSVGNKGIHEGFKSARDEMLRYVKKYIQDNNIDGNLKVWIAGHSRGGAVSNMLGAFFAGGGIEYFGNNVSITPEDVYCYTYATPRTITANIDKNIELSVEGYRGGEDYSNDTIGDDFAYTKGGQVDPKDKVYGGIRNFISPYDIITMLPFETWGYTHYGTDISVDHDGKVSESAMLKELEEVSTYAYDKYVNKNGPNLFDAMTFDTEKFKLAKDNGNINLSDYIKQRIDGLSYKVNSIDTYTNQNYQEGVKAVAGIFGMALVYFNELNIKPDVKDVLYTYLAYASERLQEEGRATNDVDTFKIAVEELITFFTKKEINDNSTVDETVEKILTYACESENEILLDKLVSLITEKIPENFQPILTGALARFHKDFNSGRTITAQEAWKAFLKACVYGTDEEAPEYSNVQLAKDVRSRLYELLGMALALLMPEDGYNLAKVAFIDDDGKCTGSGKISNLLENVYPILMKEKDENGNIIKTFQNFGEAADYKLVNLIDKIFDSIITDSKEKYGEKFQSDLRKHVEHAKENISSIREVVMYFLLYDSNGFNTERIVKNLSTFINNPGAIALPHYNEIYVAYAKAVKSADCGYINHVTQKNIDETEDDSIKIETEEQNLKDDSKKDMPMPENPKTDDNIQQVVLVFIISILGIFVMKKIMKK